MLDLREVWIDIMVELDGLYSQEIALKQAIEAAENIRHSVVLELQNIKTRDFV